MGPLATRRPTALTVPPRRLEGPAAGLTLARCVDLTGLRWGAHYRLSGGEAVLEECTELSHGASVRDFFGRSDLLREALDRAQGQPVSLRNVIEDQMAARSVLARAGVSTMLAVPTGPDELAILGAPRVSARWQLGQPGHTQRVSRYAQLLALLRGLPQRHSELLGQAAALHDVGKLNVPPAVLLKPGPLSAAERATVQCHAPDGRAILAGPPHPLTDLAATIAVTHHERWDGTGYPHGLRAGQIPLAGRIAAIADVYDALTSHRPYRPALSAPEAARLMTRGAGSQFDPHLLHLFLHAMPRMHSMRERMIARARERDRDTVRLARALPAAAPV